MLAQLAAQGVLLAIASKNGIDDVKAVLARHPDMVLREDAFVAISANWRPKSDNISEIAGALNLGADSFVFVDDSPFECEASWPSPIATRRWSGWRAIRRCTCTRCCAKAGSARVS